ncbi:site-2 protease family protein [Candidatus Saccharibacteria bacterium]|nr:site-2 protease family protein [Candidatus Saccharibacteria bacterium]
MMIVIGVIVGLIALMLLVTAHEFGHFLMARRNGVEVEEFGIGFMPRAIAWRKVDGKWRKLTRAEWKKPPGKGLIISLNWLPIGGFCQMKGESDAAKEKGSFGQATFWQKTKILFGGVLANWLVAWVILSALAFVGMPHFLENQFMIESDAKVVATKPVTISDIVEGGPAAQAGMQNGDVIVSMRQAQDENGEGLKIANILLVDDVTAFTKEFAGQEIYISYERGGDTVTRAVKLNDRDSEYILGAGLTGDAVYMSSWSAPIVGLGTMFQVTGETFKGIGELVVNFVGGVAKQVNPNEEVRKDGAKELKEAGDSVSGPVGIVGILFPAFTQSGPRNLMFLVALISISLACMNVLPIPALDGGRWLLIAIWRLRGKKLKKETEEKIVGRAFLAILILAVVVTILDVMRLAR